MESLHKWGCWGWMGLFPNRSEAWGEWFHEQTKATWLFLIGLKWNSQTLIWDHLPLHRERLSTSQREVVWQEPPQLSSLPHASLRERKGILTLIQSESCLLCPMPSPSNPSGALSYTYPSLKFPFSTMAFHAPSLPAMRTITLPFSGDHLLRHASPNAPQWAALPPPHILTSISADMTLKALVSPCPLSRHWSPTS